MASYSVNKKAVARARELIDAKQYVLDSDWGDAQPKAEDENKFLKTHDWDDYAAWHLGLTDGANDDTKARYAFVYGDLRPIHRTGLIACVYRASEWRHKEIELAVVAVRIVAGDVQQCLRDGQRGAELVGGVGCESLLFGDVLFESGEHRVERVGEFAEFVSAAR